MQRVFTLFAAAVLAGMCVGQAHEPTGSSHAVIAPNSLHWKPFVPGAELAVLEGNPNQEGMFTIRIRIHAGTEIPPHWHPADENITVLTGAFGIGMGDTFEQAAIRTMAAGAFVSVPKGMRHFALSKTDSIVQIHGKGPFVMNFVNNDDQSGKARKGNR